MVTQDAFFTDFPEWWAVAKYFSAKQRRAIIRSLPVEQRKAIEASFRRGHYADITMRNRADKVLDAVLAEFGHDLLEVKRHVLRGKSVRVNRAFWDEVCDRFQHIPERHKAYIFGGYRASREEEDSQEYRLVREGR